MDRNDDKRISFWELAPQYVNEWRIFPRAFILMYFWLLWTFVNWFIALDNPTAAQASVVSVVIGTGAAWFGLYVGRDDRGGISRTSYMRGGGNDRGVM